MNEYLKKYPWLRGYEDIEDENPVCSLEWIPKGWVIAFGEEMCQELDAALRKTGSYDDAYVSELKEKYGSLRMYIHPTNDEIENIISKYAAISEHVCEHCGAVDVPMLNIGGWFSPYCKTCYDKINHDGRFKPFNESMDSELQMPNVLKWRQYNKDGWQNYEMDIKETVDTIREKAKREGRSFYES